MNKVIVTTAVALLIVAAAQAPAQTVRRPPRDVGGLRSDPVSTAAIGGRITAADSGMPLRRVEITATAANNETFPRATITDDNGRYELTGLAAGEWRLTTLKSGFISQQFGQRRPFGSAPPIAVSDGQRFTADFALTRASAINGRVFDELGEPLAAVRINVLRSRMVQKQRRLEPVGGRPDRRHRILPPLRIAAGRVLRQRKPARGTRRFGDPNDLLADLLPRHGKLCRGAARAARSGR